jgi:hypothetical protein
LPEWHKEAEPSPARAYRGRLRHLSRAHIPRRSTLSQAAVTVRVAVLYPIMMVGLQDLCENAKVTRFPPFTTTPR